MTSNQQPESFSPHEATELRHAVTARWVQRTIWVYVAASAVSLIFALIATAVAGTDAADKVAVFVYSLTAGSMAYLIAAAMTFPLVKTALNQGSDLGTVASAAAKRGKWVLLATPLWLIIVIALNPTPLFTLITAVICALLVLGQGVFLAAQSLRKVRTMATGTTITP